MLLHIDKPYGFTSFDIVKKVKRIHRSTPRVKVGHAGTLDPAATGLLIIGIGKGTKQLHHLLGLDKTYEATISLTKRSDTRDLDAWEWSADENSIDSQHDEAKKRGRTNFHRETPTIETLNKRAEEMIGTKDILLTPFSAKKQQGKKLYQFARAGTPILRQQAMTIHSLEIVSYNFPEVAIRCNVGSGTYIRSIGQTLGNHFGRGGVLTALRRTSIGPYSVDALQ